MYITLTPSEFLVGVAEGAFDPCQLIPEAGKATCAMIDYLNETNDLPSPVVALGLDVTKLSDDCRVMISGTQTQTVTITEEAVTWGTLIDIAINQRKSGRPLPLVLEFVMRNNFGQYIYSDGVEAPPLRNLFDHTFHLITHIDPLNTGQGPH